MSTTSGMNYNGGLAQTTQSAAAAAAAAKAAASENSLYDLSSTSSSSHHFFILPYEIRHQIYEELFSASSAIVVRTTNHGVPSDLSDWDRTMLQAKSTIPTAIFYTNKQISKEALSALYKTLHIHVNFFQRLPDDVVRPSDSTYRSRIPLDLRHHLRRATYHIREPWDKVYSHPRQPATPFPFVETPNLTRFSIQKRMEFNIAWLGNSTRDRITPTAYLALNADERLAFWNRVGLTDCQKILKHVAGCDSGTNWIRKLLLPDTYDNPDILTSSPRSTPRSSFSSVSFSPSLSHHRGSFGSIDSVAISPPAAAATGARAYDSDHPEPPSPAIIEYTVGDSLGIPPSCAIVVEADIQLYLRDETGGVKYMETLAMEVDARGRKLLSQSFVTDDEVKRKEYHAISMSSSQCKMLGNDGEDEENVNKKKKKKEEDEVVEEKQQKRKEKERKRAGIYYCTDGDNTPKPDNNTTTVAPVGT